LLTPQDYGLIGMVAILINFVTMFQYMGLSTATIKWAELSHQQVSTLFWINLSLSVCITLMTAASAPLVAWFYHEPRLIGVTLGYALSILLSGLVIQHEALLARQMRFTTMAVIDVVSLLIGLAAALIAAWYGMGYWALVLNQWVIQLIRIIGNWTASRWRPGWPVRGLGVRAMLSYGGDITGFNIVNFFARNLDNTLIGKFWGAQQLGLYAKAYQLLLLPMEQINGPLGSVAVPALSRLADSPERYRTAYLKLLEKLSMITMPGVVFMVAMSDWLVLLLLGPQWRETGRIFMLLGIAAFMQPVTKTCWWLFSSQGRTRDLLRVGVLSAGIAVSAIIAGLPWGAVGVALAYAVSDFCLVTPLTFWFAARRGPVRVSDFYRTIAPAACASICAFGVLLICRQWLEPFPLALRLMVAFGITLGVSLSVLMVLPAGRAAVQNFKDTLLLLVRSRKNESPV
jgi:O-antigen/teichoic acid export membrane protein